MEMRRHLGANGDVEVQNPRMMAAWASINENGFADVKHI